MGSHRRAGPIRASVNGPGRKASLVVLFIPSVGRDGATKVDQSRWVGAALKVLGRIFGGATAFPRARGVWRDDERGGVLIFDEPVVIHCYATRSQVENGSNLAPLVEFCREMGRATHQGEIGLVIDNTYWAITDYRRH